MLFKPQPTKKDVIDLVKKTTVLASMYTVDRISVETFEEENLKNINEFLIKFGKDL